MSYLDECGLCQIDIKRVGETSVIICYRCYKKHQEMEKQLEFYKQKLVENGVRI